MSKARIEKLRQQLRAIPRPQKPAESLSIGEILWLAGPDCEALRNYRERIGNVVPVEPKAGSEVAQSLRDEMLSIDKLDADELLQRYFVKVRGVS